MIILLCRGGWMRCKIIVHTVHITQQCLMLFCWMNWMRTIFPWEVWKMPWRLLLLMFSYTLLRFSIRMEGRGLNPQGRTYRRLRQKDTESRILTRDENRQCYFTEKHLFHGESDWLLLPLWLLNRLVLHYSSKQWEQSFRILRNFSPLS